METAALAAGARPRVMILFGGRSGEHAISCATAAGVLRAIDREKWDVLPVGITRDGQWVVAADDPAQWEIREGQLPEVTASAADVVLPMASGARELRVLTPGQVPIALGDVDVVFPLLHGPFGEDGTVQGMLEMSDIHYVGAGVLASAVGMDKHFMKVVLENAGLPITPYRTLWPQDLMNNPEGALEAVHDLQLPAFVKPARAGSSLGITKVTDWSQLLTAIATAQEHDPKVIVEQGVVGREIECAVLEGRAGQPPRTSQPGEIRLNAGADHEFYDFAAKYLDEASVELSCPADLPAAAIAQIQDAAARTFTALATEGLARVDVFYTEAGEVIVNEINTMPGFTPFSMYPRMWQASGMSYPDLIDELLTLAISRPTGLR